MRIYRQNGWQALLRFGGLGLFLLGLVACGKREAGSGNGAVREEAAVVTNADVVAAMLAAMGGESALEAVDNVVLHGTGTRRHFGQIPETGGVETPGTIDVTEIIDLANGQAAFQNSVQTSGGFPQERTEVLTHYKGKPMAWATTGGRPNHVTSVDGIFSWASHNSPEWLLRRNIISLVLAARDAEPEAPAQASAVAGTLVWALPVTLATDWGTENITLYVNQDSMLLSSWSSLDTETMVGDTQAMYNVSDYQQVGDLLLPFSLSIDKNDGVYLDLVYDDITLNSADMSLFDIPADVVEEAEQVLATDGSWVELEWHEVAEGVVAVRAFSHHSMVVEFADYVVVVEAPYTEGQSRTLARMIDERIGKPIRYVVPTHPHYDHTGGVRALVAEGADVLVSPGHEAEIRMLVDALHSNPSDLLAQRRAAGEDVGEIELFSDRIEIAESGMTLELYAVTTIPHVNPMVLAYVPEAGVLFQSDLFFGAASADAQALYDAVISRGLEVETIIGGHDPLMLPFSSLEEAVGSLPE